MREPFRQMMRLYVTGLDKRNFLFSVRVDAFVVSRCSSEVR